jgi:hypothetical protein
MTLADERLTVRKSRAYARFVEEFTFALKETEPSKAAMEEALRDQIDHGRRLLEMGEAACYLASVKRLQPDAQKDMEWALTTGVRAFRDLQERVADWTRRQGESLKGTEELGPLVVGMDRCRAELASGSQQATASAELENFPKVGTAEWGQMNQRRAELIRRNNHGELSAEEREEYETLQRLSLAAVEAAYPRQGNGTAPVDLSGARGG